MIELLALPGWQTPPRSLDDWVAQLTEHGGGVTVSRESSTVAWVELGALRLRGYVVLDGSRVEAINFELGAVDHAPALGVVTTAASSLGWEVHEDDDGAGDADED